MAGTPFTTWTPVGRMIQGNPLEMTPKKDDKTGRPILDDMGKPKLQSFMMVAFPKVGSAITLSDRNSAAIAADFEQVRGHFEAIAQRDFPQGEYQSPVFSRKIIDGDGVDDNGKRWDAKEGFAGHWALRVTSNYPYLACDSDTNNRAPINDPGRFKRGHYVRVFVNVSGNENKIGSKKTPGLYVNPSMVQWMAFGPEIQGGPDVEAIMAQAPATVLPAAASAAPLAVSGQPASAPAQLPQHPGGYVPPPAVGQQQQPPPPAPVVAPLAQWPPAGWFTNGVAEGSYHDGKEVLTEAQLCARLGVVRPHAAILGR